MPAPSTAAIGHCRRRARTESGGAARRERLVSRLLHERFQRSSINPQNTAPLTPAQGQKNGTAAELKGPFTATTVNGDSKDLKDPQLRPANHLGLPRTHRAPRDAARVGLCASVPGRFAPHPMRCSAVVPVPVLQTPRARLCGSSDTNLAHTRIAGRATAQRAAANRLHAYCAPATPEASPRRVLVPFYAADARLPSCARRSEIRWGEGNRRGVLRLGLKLRTLRIGAALLSPPLSMPPQRRSQREAALLDARAVANGRAPRTRERVPAASSRH